MLLENTDFHSQEGVYDKIKPTDSKNMYLPRTNLEQGSANIQGSNSN